MEILTGHTSPETAYVVADYPYGFRLRCQMRYWVEFKPGFGCRVVSQTTNPKKPGTVWNKPKTGIYHLAVVLVIDPDTGHVSNDALSPYANTDALDGFLTKYGTAIPAAALGPIANHRKLQEFYAARYAALESA